MLTASGFNQHRFPFTDEPTIQRAPGNYDSRFPGDIPRASVGVKVLENMANSSGKFYQRLVPYSGGWESNISEGMPLWVNSKTTPNNCPTVLGGSPAIINYFLEEGARSLSIAESTNIKRKRAEMSQDYEKKEHLYCDGAAELFMNNWRYYGVVSNIAGTSADVGFSGMSRGDEMLVNCNVSRYSSALNYWGNVGEGDAVGWLVGMKRNVNPYFYDPNGTIIGDAVNSPSSFLQMIPVSFKSATRSCSHNRNWFDMESPMRNDLDFMYRNMSVQQHYLRMNMDTGDFEEEPLNLASATQKVKTTNLGCDLYAFGAYIPMGIVLKGTRERSVTSEDELNLAIRSDKKAQTLPKISLLLKT